jgi:hypothetical protein
VTSQLVVSHREIRSTTSNLTLFTLTNMTATRQLSELQKYVLCNRPRHRRAELYFQSVKHLPSGASRPRLSHPTSYADEKLREKLMTEQHQRLLDKAIVWRTWQSRTLSSSLTDAWLFGFASTYSQCRAHIASQVTILVDTAQCMYSRRSKTIMPYLQHRLGRPHSLSFSYYQPLYADAVSFIHLTPQRERLTGTILQSVFPSRCPLTRLLFNLCPRFVGDIGERFPAS